MNLLVSLLLRAVVLVVALVFAASVAVALVIAALVLALRLLWARLTGRPVPVMAGRFDPRAAFGEVMRRGARPGTLARRPRADDVTDVKPK